MSAIAIGCDHGGYALKEKIKKLLLQMGKEVTDVGTFSETSVDYPDFVLKAVKLVASGECEKGIVICGTGIGASMAANKVHGIRAAVCVNEFMAHATREHNDANVLALGARVVGDALACEIAKVFLQTNFSNDARHIQRLKKIEKIEAEN